MSRAPALALTNPMNNHTRIYLASRFWFFFRQKKERKINNEKQTSSNKTLRSKEPEAPLP
jgi:hypothetical protein